MVAAINLTLLGNYAVEETEATAMEQGIVLAQMLGLEKIMVKGDSLQSIQVIQAKDSREWLVTLLLVLSKKCQNFNW